MFTARSAGQIGILLAFILALLLDLNVKLTVNSDKGKFFLLLLFRLGMNRGGLKVWKDGFRKQEREHRKFFGSISVIATGTPE